MIHSEGGATAPHTGHTVTRTTIPSILLQLL